jgi:excisionase family DNA binding protein
MALFGNKLELLSIKDAAGISPYSPDYLNFLVRKGKIKATKVGRDWLLTKFDLFEYVKKQYSESKNRQQYLAKYLNLSKDANTEK